jgi:hypothetical protein
MNSLREPLSPEQLALLRVIFGPFDATGEWPVWQYADLTLDAMGIDAQATLESLPVAGDPGPMSRSYGLTWRNDSHMSPRPDARVALTMAALRHLPGAEPLVGAFFTTLRYLVDQQRKLIPSPGKVVEATVAGEAIAEQLLTASIAGSSAPPVDAIMTKLREVLGNEPPLYSAVYQRTAEDDWTIRVPAALREYRDVTTIDDYLDQVCTSVMPGEPPGPVSSEPADLPTAVGYLDAVWMSRTGSHLFVNLDAASVARLLFGCGSENDFNSLMSALADVLAQVTAPGKAKPPQGSAIRKVKEYLAESLDADAAERAGAAMDTLDRIRLIRVGGQHADARYKAVKAFGEIGLAFPPPSWPFAWTHVSWLAKEALDVVREEAHAGLARP